MNYRLTVLSLAWLFGLFSVPSSTFPVLPTPPHKVMNTNIVKAAIDILEVYNTPTPPPGAMGNYPKGHVVLRYRLENTQQTPIGVDSIHISLFRKGEKDALVYAELLPSLTLEGLQILEQGKHLYFDETLAEDTNYQLVLQYNCGGVNQKVESIGLKLESSPNMVRFDVK